MNKNPKKNIPKVFYMTRTLFGFIDSNGLNTYYPEQPLRPLGFIGHQPKESSFAIVCHVAIFPNIR